MILDVKWVTVMLHTIYVTPYTPRCLNKKNSDISDYNGPKTKDTFELRSINGIPIFVSEEWREGPNGGRSIADWVYETNKTVAPICYFKVVSHTVNPD